VSDLQRRDEPRRACRQHRRARACISGDGRRRRDGAVDSYGVRLWALLYGRLLTVPLENGQVAFLSASFELPTADVWKILSR
jgi:hypothetical protein